MSIGDTDAVRELRLAFARGLFGAGTFGEEWRRVVESVPRHVLVPFFYRQDVGRGWRRISATDPDYFEAVYSDSALTTQVIDGVPTSSSSQPSLMLGMLDALDVTDGSRVLEIATGTGYNAALLSERVGSRHVYSVEVDEELARDARNRLLNCGYEAVIAAGDGRKGLSECAPYDRLIATCGFTSVPYAWIQQVRPGGIIVCPLGSGNARLTVNDRGQAEGKFLPGGACFIGVRSQDGSATVPYPGTPETPAVQETRVNPSLTVPDGPQFMLSLVLPETVWANEKDPDGSWPGCRLWARDGSWAHIAGSEVRQSGPRGLWDVVEGAYEWWEEHGRPERERFGVTVTEAGTRYWLDAQETPLPDGPAGG